MGAKPQRQVMGKIVVAARLLGGVLIALALLDLPLLRSLTGRLAGSLQLLSSVALLVAGIVWLVAVELFIRFFDRYLSGN